MISVIIPVLNEERALPATLDQLLCQSGAFEIIVVDGGSTDRSGEIARRYDRVRLMEAPTGRARQLNAGARQASGEWLLFLHADTLLPADALQRIRDLPGDVLAGGFRHRFSGHGAGLRLISWLHNLRCRCTRVFYGDQSPFIRRRLFEKLGGYPDQPILEDLLLGERIAAHTRPVILAAEVITDSRKFEQQGVWLGLWRVMAILLRHELRLHQGKRTFFSPIR